MNGNMRIVVLLLCCIVCLGQARRARRTSNILSRITSDWNLQNAVRTETRDILFAKLLPSILNLEQPASSSSVLPKPPTKSFSSMLLALRPVATVVRTPTRSRSTPVAAVAKVWPNARRLILVRHGAVDREKSDPPLRSGAVYGGNVDVPLSSIGEAEAIAAAKFIAAEHGDEVSAIWSSPMSRALFGAKCISVAIDEVAEEGLLPIGIESDEAFREIDRGPVGSGWTGLTLEEIEDRDGPNAMACCANEKEFGAYKSINGGEGFCDLRLRVLKKRDACLAALPLGRAGVIVSHMWVTRAIAGEALLQPDPMKVGIPTASVTIIDYPENFSLEAYANGACGSPIVRAVGIKPALDK